MGYCCHSALQVKGGVDSQDCEWNNLRTKQCRCFKLIPLILIKNSTSRSRSQVKFSKNLVRAITWEWGDVEWQASFYHCHNLTSFFMLCLNVTCQRLGHNGRHEYTHTRLTNFASQTNLDYNYIKKIEILKATLIKCLIKLLLITWTVDVMYRIFH